MTENSQTPAPASAPTAPPGASTTSAPTSAPSPPPPERRYQWLSTAAFAAVGLVGVLVVLYAWRLPPFTSPVISTENATVRGQVTIVGTQLSGYVTQVNVQDFADVKAGQLLVKIDDRIYQQRLDQAEAQLAAQQAALSNWAQQHATSQANTAVSAAALANAEAQARKAAADLARVEQLVADGSLSQREYDQSRATQAQMAAALAQARANVEIAHQSVRSVVVSKQSLEAAVANAQAAVKAAKIDLDNTNIVAPDDGQLGQVTVRQGAFVNSGAQLMALVPRQMWIIANYKETQMNGVQEGQSATFRVDALDGAELTGQVERISPATGSEFSILPADNATGNYLKIAQRIPVRIRIDPGQANARRLLPGMSVEVSIDTSAELNDSAHNPAPPPAPKKAKP